MSEFSLRCRRPDALKAVVHDHLPARDPRGFKPGGEFLKDTSPACCEAYWQCVRHQEQEVASRRAASDQVALSRVLAVSAENLHDARDMQAEKIPETDVNVGPELSVQEREALEKELAAFSATQAEIWKGRAEKEEWDEVKADLTVYRLSGETVTSDPRRTPEYREQVIEGLGFGMESKRSDLRPEDLAAIREVVGRKAAAFWLEGTPRTTVRNVAHDCIPTGPPVSLQPHALKGESAAWVDERLEEEVQRGQLVRGTSAWGSPPFPTKEAPAHKKHRKRRLVVDYRRVNARVLRSTYYCRRATDVLASAAGSVWFSFVDAVTGFNQIANTRRAMEVLAIVARSGKFLPVCLTFGPVNGPDDFCYVVDRAYGPGRNRKLRYTREWVAYVDDLTVRTGRVIDGRFFTDEEHEKEIRQAMREAPVQLGQSPADAMDALGIRPGSLGTGARGKHDEKESDHNHPTHLRSQGCFHSRMRWVGSVERVKKSSSRFFRDRKFPKKRNHSRTRTRNRGSRVPRVSPKGLFRVFVAAVVVDRLFPQPFGSETGRVGQASLLGLGCFEAFKQTSRARFHAGLAGWVRVSRPTRGIDRSAGRACVSRLARDLEAMGGKGRKGKRQQRDPRTDWGDLEFLVTKALRHGVSKSIHGKHDLRRSLRGEGWAPLSAVARAFGVSEADVLECVRAQDRNKIRLEVDREWVRACQAHSCDSGLSTRDFAEGVEYPDHVQLAHGSLKERVPSIVQGGLLAGGGGELGSGRLFVHWTPCMGTEPGRPRYSGVRTNSDCLVVTTVGELRAAGVPMYPGVDGVVCSGDTPPEALLRIVLWEKSHLQEGGEGDPLWTREEGFIEAPLPTGDTEESTSEAEEEKGKGQEADSRVGVASSRSDRGQDVDMGDSAEGREKAPSSPLLEPEEEEEMVAIPPPAVGILPTGVVPTPAERGRQLEELDRPLTAFEQSLRSPSPEVEVPQERWLSPDGTQCLICNRGMQSDQHGGHTVSWGHLRNMEKLRRRMREENRQRGVVDPPPAAAPAPIPAPAPEPAEMEEVELEEEEGLAPVEEELEEVELDEEEEEPAPASASAPKSKEEEAEGGQRPSKQLKTELKSEGAPVSRVGVAPSRSDRGPDRSRGEMGSGELQEVWSSKPRTVGQRMLESALTAASSHELRYQEANQEGLERLVNKEAERSTPGGKDQLDRTLRAITTNTAASAVLRKRAGQEMKTTGEHEFGRFITEDLTGGAGDRLKAAEEVQARALEKDTRYEAAVRESGAASRTDKRAARARLRAAGHRKAESKTLAEERLSKEEKDVRETGWVVDDGVEDLDYAYGSWACAWCRTINGPDEEACKGWVKGHRCRGSYSESFGWWAKSKGPKELKKTRTQKVVPRLQLELQKEAWWCERCWQGNLCFRVKCYKCSAERPALSDSSDDDEQGPRRNAKTESAAESYLKQQKRERGLRKHRKRGGVKEKARKTKKRRRVVRSGPAAKLAFRGFRAARPKRSP